MIWTLESSYVLQTLQQRIQANSHEQRYNLELLNVKHRLLNLSMRTIVFSILMRTSNFYKQKIIHINDCFILFLNLGNPYAKDLKNATTRMIIP